MTSKNDPASRAIQYVRAVLFEERINHFLHEKKGTDSYITLLSPVSQAQTSIRFERGIPGAEKGSPEGPRYTVHEKATATSEAVTHEFTTIEPLLKFLDVEDEKIKSLRIKFASAQAVNDLKDSLSPRIGM